MKVSVPYLNKIFTANLQKPLDISLSLRGDDKNPVAWYLTNPKITPVKDRDFIGKVSEGASTNFNNVFFNPHAHGTHTECVGHITREFHSVNETLKTFFFTAEVISIVPLPLNGDHIITRDQLSEKLKNRSPEAVIIRTMPNYIEKRIKKYFHTNWPYLEEAAAKFLRETGIKHLLIDLPSVDKEKDEGKLLAHKAFWDYPKNTRFDATITELIYVPNKIEDGSYLLNLQIASFENDAAPSKPILYKLE